MRSDKNLDKRAKEVIISKMEDLGEITVDEVVDIMRPHFIFDIQLAKEKEMRRKAHSLMAALHDSSGIRNCYSDNDGRYINIDMTTNLPVLRKVKCQLQNKYIGLNSALKKVDKREQILESDSIHNCV